MNRMEQNTLTQQQMKTNNWKRWLLLLIVPLLSLVAIQPILTGILPWRGDGLLHLYRLAELERAVRAGLFFPRWSPDLGYGFGFPLFNYYAPFSYYVALIPRLLGASLPVSMAVSYVLALWMLGWGVWFWARDVWQSGLAAVTAVLAILYAPYILYNTYHRAALAELWGLAFLGLTLWATQRLFGGWGAGGLGRLKYALLTAVFYALLILSHNITALIGTPLIIGYALFLTINREQGTRNTQQSTNPLTIYHYSPLLLALALSAFFWLPAFFERNLVQIENLTATAAFSYLNNFLTLSDIFAWPQTAVSQQVNPNIPRSLSWPIFILAIFAWLPIKKEGGGWGLGAGQSPIPNPQSPIPQRTALTFATLLCLLMTTPLSQPIWQAFDLLSFVQFPWRFLGPASLFLALLAGLGAQQLWNLLSSQFTIHNSQFTIILTALITLYALPWLFPSPANTLPTNITPAETIQFEIQTGWLGTTAAADYLPRTVQTLPAPDDLTTHLDTTQFPDTFTIENLQEEYTAVSLTYTAAETVTAVLHIFHFPGWQATLDGEPIQITPSDPTGQITIQLPAGSHTVQLRFGNTPLRTVANTISIITLLLLIILIVYSIKNNQQSTTPLTINHFPFTINHYSFSQFILPAILTVSAIFLLKTAVLDQNNTIFRTTQPSALSTQPSTLANFNNTIQLIGTDLPSDPIPADQPIDLTLIWQALPPVAEEVSISVQLIGENNVRYAQSDSFHPAGLPLPRWQAGEFGLDVHRLTPLPATPPGEYQLTLFVYNTANGTRLDLLNENQQPIGNEYTLGNITLSSPTQFPNPDELTISNRPTDNTFPYLLGYEQPITERTVGENIPLTLFWYSAQPPSNDYQANIRLACQNGGELSSVPLPRTNTPNKNWQAGQLQRLDTAVSIPPINKNGTAIANDLCTLTLQLKAEETSTAIPLGTFPITAPARSYTLPATAVSINQSFANQLTLAAIDLDKSSYQQGDTIDLILYWQPQALFNDEYKVFVQLLGADGRIIAQQDQIPANGTRPTTGWIANEIISDSYQLTIPSDAPPGTYTLITGLYNAQTQQRLSLTDQSGNAITIPLPIEVKLAE